VDVPLQRLHGLLGRLNFQIQDLGEKSSIYLRLKNLEEKGFFEESLEEKEAEIGGRLA